MALGSSKIKKMAQVQENSCKKVAVSLTFHNLHPNSVKYHVERCLTNLLALKVLIHPFHRSILFAKRFVAFKKMKVSTVNLRKMAMT